MNKNKNKVSKALMMLLGCVLVLIILNLIRINNAPYSKYTARVGTYVVSVDADALVVRDEHVVTLDREGIMEAVVSEGERVSAYTHIGSVITGQISEDKITRLNVLNHEIETLTRTLAKSGILAIADEEVDGALKMCTDKLRYAAAKNNTEEIMLQTENIRILNERKKGVTTTGTAQTRLDAAKSERAKLTSELGGSHKDIYAPTSGLYSNDMDGLESVLTMKNIQKVTPEFVTSAFEKLEDKNNKPNGVCKIINNYKWYIVFNLSEEDCDKVAVGKDYQVNFKELNDTRLTGIVEYISPADENGMCAISMQFDSYIEDFTTIRDTRVEVCLKEYKGIYVPGNAIAVEGESVKGVWVQNEVSLEFRSVEPVYKSDDFWLVKEDAKGIGGFKNIALYDNIVLDPDDKFTAAEGAVGGVEIKE